MTKNISDITKETRIKQDLTLREFGEAVGVSHQAVSRWEQGLSIPTLERLMQIIHDYHDWRKEWALAVLDSHPYFNLINGVNDADHNLHS